MWIPSKLTIPAPLHKSIQRKRLLSSLEIANYYKLVLFQSPAGFGKTTMAAQWLAKCSNVGWFSIDELDNDPSFFANYFISALNKATKESCPKTASVVQRSQFNNLKSLFTQLIAEMTSWKEKAYFVLDDYHFIVDDDIHSAVAHFIKHMPPNITLVITSRTQPPLGIANLRVRCQLLEVNNQSLAFDDEETHRFLSQFNNAVVDENTSRILCAQVEGWPSALQLIALNSRQSRIISTLSSTKTLTHLWDYLAEEVFDQLDEEKRKFLMQCSVLSRFNHELVNAVTERDDALVQLANLNRQGLFINLVDENEQWYRFHNLFGEFLSHQRQRLMPTMEDELRARAVNAWLKANNPKQALSCAMKIKDTSVRVTVLLNQGWYLFNHGNIRLLTEALKTLSDDDLYCQPPLILLSAWLAQAQHQYNEVGELLEKGMQEMAIRNILLKSSEQGDFDALLAQVAINQNFSEQALKLSERAFEALSSNAYHSRIVATSVVGEVYHCLGELNRALPLMQLTEKLARQHEVYHQALWALLQQCEIDTARGAPYSGLEILDKAEDLVKRYHLEQVPLHEFMLGLRAQLMWSLNRLDDAETLANRSLEVISYYDATRSIPAYTTLAKICIARGELDKAERYLEQCEKLLDPAECHVDWRANLYMAQLLLWQLRENNERAAIWLETAEIPATATNHFLQLQHRNLARAHFICGNYDEARGILERILQTSRELKLISDMLRNLILLVAVQEKTGKKEEAEVLLFEAITLSSSTGMTVYFYLDRIVIVPILTRLSRQHDIDQLARHQIITLIYGMRRHNFSRAIHFDEALVEKILASNSVPDAVRSSPLTLREWQVLGLIYSGYRNDQISSKLDVAPTTIKTHIRNLYQKLQIANREQAISIAERLIKSIHS